MGRDGKTTDDTIPAGTFEGDRYFINVATEDGDPDSWCVTVGRETPSDEPNVNVVRIDTDHGRPHVDRLWLRPEEGRKEWLPPGYPVDDAIDQVTENWREYARRYAVRREGREFDGDGWSVRATEGDG